MKIGPKYKIARRLGAPVFEKTQTQKFAIAEARKGSGKGRGRPRQISDYGLQLIEKQKARYYYGLSEKQFANAIKEAQNSQGDPVDNLFDRLERRLDTVILRANFGPSRMFCRQLISHGHLWVDSRKVTVPSYRIKPGQVISIRPQSLDKGVFSGFDERLKNAQLPSWIKLDIKERTCQIDGRPNRQEMDLLFDLASVMEFYSR